MKNQANAAGLKMEPMMRKLIMGMEVKPKPPEIYAELLRELSAIGNNVNQIAHWTNTRKSISLAECQRAILLIDEAWKLLIEKLYTKSHTPRLNSLFRRPRPVKAERLLTQSLTSRSKRALTGHRLRKTSSQGGVWRTARFGGLFQRGWSASRRGICPNLGHIPR